MQLELLQTLNEQSEMQSLLENSIELNIQALADANTSAASLCETASRVLANLSIQLGSKGQVPDFDKAVNTLAGLRIIGDYKNRESLNIKPSLFKLVIQRTGDDAQLDATVEKVALNPSFRKIRSDIEQLLRDAISGDLDLRKKAVNLINKLRIGYERVANKLGVSLGAKA